MSLIKSKIYSVVRASNKTQVSVEKITSADIKRLLRYIIPLSKGDNLYVVYTNFHSKPIIYVSDIDSTIGLKNATVLVYNDVINYYRSLKDTYEVQEVYFENLSLLVYKDIQNHMYKGRYCVVVFDYDKNMRVIKSRMPSRGVSSIQPLILD